MNRSKRGAAAAFFGLMLLFLGACVLAGCRGGIPKEEVKEEVKEPQVVPERTDAPVYDARTVAKLLHLPYTEEELAVFGPPPAPRLGFITFFDPGWSVWKFSDFPAHTRFEGKDAPRWWLDFLSTFGHSEVQGRTEAPRYRQIRMGPVPGSFGKKWEEQCALLSPQEEVPHVRQVLAALLIHRSMTGELLFLRGYWVQCADVLHYSDTTVVSRVNIGEPGWHRDSVWIGYNDPPNEVGANIGLASAWKLS